MKKILLILFILFSATGLYSQERPAQDPVKIDIMYFHATIRCQGCLSIEASINSIVNNKYANELRSGKFSLKSVDFLENEKLADKYDIETQALIISKRIKGKEVKWVNLDKIWDYSGDYEKFQAYIEEEINKLINES